MKIGYLLQAGAPEIRSAPFSGPANHVRQVCQEWLKLGHSVRLLALQDGRLWKSDDLANFEPVRVPAMDDGLPRLAESAIRRVQAEFKLPYLALFESLRFAWACHRELAGVDVLFERSGWFGFGGALAARWLKVPLVLEINGDLLTERQQLGIAPHGWQHQIASRAMQAEIRAAAGYVATGEGWRARFAEQWRVDPARIAVVENGSAVVDLLDRAQLRSFQSEAGPLTELVFTGSFDPWQGLPVLIEAFALAARQEPDLRLSIIGAGAGQEALTRQIADHHLEKRVACLGWLPIEQMAARLACSDIGVSPYCGRVEFSGLKLLDYKAAGLATIASGQAGQPAVLRHGQTGWVVPPCDVQALSEAILQLSRDRQLRRQIGQAARLEAEQAHSWRHTAGQLIQVFSQVGYSEREA